MPNKKPTQQAQSLLVAGLRNYADAVCSLMMREMHDIWGVPEEECNYTATGRVYMTSYQGQPMIWVEVSGGVGDSYSTFVCDQEVADPVQGQRIAGWDCSSPEDVDKFMENGWMW